MKPLSEWDETDLELIVRTQLQENSAIEYKSSGNLDFSSKDEVEGGLERGQYHRDEITRDVTAMANAEGGRIYYSIAERKGGFPKKVDDGIERSKTTAEQIEQILRSNIRPECEDFKIFPIELTSKGRDRFGYIISVTKATKNAPYQAIDKHYYRRHERTRSIMNDNEIRDAMRRSIEYGRQFGAAWDLSVEVRRLASAIRERLRMDTNVYGERDRLIISVSQGLRSAGNAMILLPKQLRGDAADLVAAIDQFNSIIELVDPGQRGNARLNEELKADLGRMLRLADQISSATTEVLDAEP